MADALPPDPEKPVPVQPPLVILPERGTTPPPGVPVVRILLENDTADRALPRWVVWLLRAFGVTLLGGLGTIVVAVFWILQLRAQVESIDAKIDARVAAKADDVRKEVFAESKTAKEELDTLNKAIEFERSFRELICQGAYDSAIQLYYATLDYLRPKDIPDAIKPAVYRLFVEAVVRSGKYGTIKEDELDRIDAVLRKDLVTCGAGTLDRIAILYATMGQFEKARTVSASVVNVFAASREGHRGQDEIVAPIYATLLFIELCQQKGDNPDLALDRAWRLLRELEQRRLIRTDAIDASFDLSEMSAATSYILLEAV